MLVTRMNLFVIAFKADTKGFSNIVIIVCTFISAMSQPSSQGSNCSLEPFLSQETLDQMFSSVHSMFQNQGDLQRYKCLLIYFAFVVEIDLLLL